MAVAVILAIAGLILLTIAADHLVLGASRISTSLRISPVVVGVVVIGLGTSAPEFLVSGIAAAQGNGGIAMGNLIGSNILNLTLILGIAALLRPIRIASGVLRREAPATVAATATFAVAAATGLNWMTGAVLAVLTAVALWWMLRIAATTTDRALSPEVSEFLGEPPVHRPLPETVRAVLGLGGVLGGAQLLVVNAADIAGRFGVPDVVIGFTLVAIGTSLPELVTAVQAQRRGEADLVVGNLLGSNLFNSLAGGAIVGLASGTTAVTSTWPLLMAMILTGALAWALLFRGRRLSRVEGAVLLAAYAVTLPLLS